MLSISISSWNLLKCLYSANTTERGDRRWKEAQRRGEERVTLRITLKCLLITLNKSDHVFMMRVCPMKSLLQCWPGIKVRGGYEPRYAPWYPVPWLPGIHWEKIVFLRYIVLLGALIVNMPQYAIFNAITMCILMGTLITLWMG